MQEFVLDGARWAAALNFYDDLLQALGPAYGQGKNLNAFAESMVDGGMLAIDPPYCIRVINVADDEIAAEIEALAAAVADLRRLRRSQRGEDVNVAIEFRREPRT